MIGSNTTARRGLRLVAAALTSVVVFGAGAAYAMVPGVDTSNWQHSTSLNWTSVAHSGVKFAFLKATEGSFYSDPYLASDWTATAKNGIYHGAYHFARPSVGSGVSQAEYFVSRLPQQNTRGTLPPVLDLEATGGLSPSQLVTWTRQWLQEVAALTGRTPMIYVSPAFWVERLGNSTAFHAYPLWIANYGVSSPQVPGGWPTWSFWQSTSSGRISGISGNVDRDVFNGSMAQLQRFALAATTSTTAVTLRASNPAPMTGQSVKFSGGLTSGSLAVSGRNVSLSTRASGATTWTRVASATTSSTGAYSFARKVVAAGGYEVTFAGDSAYKPSVSPLANLRLTPTPTTIGLTASASKAAAGTKVKFSGLLKTAAGAPLTSRPVVLSAQSPGSTTWHAVATATTDQTGAFAFSPAMTTTRTFRADFAGDPAYSHASSVSRSVSVTKSPTTLSLVARPLAAYANRAASMTGYLRAGTLGVPNATVLIQRQLVGSTTWTAVATTRTQAGGLFSAAPVINRAATYRAVFAGTTMDLASTSLTQKVTIAPPRATTLSLTDRLAHGRMRAGSSAVVSGILRTTRGTPLAGSTVRLLRRIDGTSRWYVAQWTRVATNGSWHLTVRPHLSCTYRAAYVGNTVNAPAMSSAVHVTTY
ncbi:MAG: hypothetical protein M3Z50_00240 [Actinomycetota bacterium]|nr:hypothetical protein [Actinomycetota bacterium]